MLRSFAPLAAPGRRATVFLASLVSLGLVCVLAASSVGRPIGTAAVCTVVLLAVLGCLSGGSPRAVRTVVLLVLLGAGLTMQVYGSLMALFLLLPVGVLVSRGERRPAVVLAVAATATMSLLSTRLTSSGPARCRTPKRPTVRSPGTRARSARGRPPPSSPPSSTACPTSLPVPLAAAAGLPRIVGIPPEWGRHLWGRRDPRDAPGGKVCDNFPHFAPPRIFLGNTRVSKVKYGDTPVTSP